MSSIERLKKILRVYAECELQSVVDTDDLAFLLRNVKAEDIVMLLSKVKGKNGDSALHTMARLGHEELIKRILASLPQYKCSEAIANWDYTPLHTAAFYGKIEACNELLSHLAAWQQVQLLSTFDSNGYTAAALAAKNGFPSESALLQQRLNIAYIG